MSLARRPPPLDVRDRRFPELAPGVAAAAQAGRAVLRAALLAGWTLPCAAVQAVLLLLPGAGKRDFARLYWAGACRLLGVRVRVVGQVAAGGRPVLFISNHTSWIDVLVLGGTLKACFVAKAEVSRWPLIRTIARLGRTVFVSRRARDAGRERDDMRARFAAGDNLLLFPEGTSSDGARVLPFRSAFFSVAEAPPGGVAPLIQPVSIVYDRLNGLPARRPHRALTSWYGDMELGSHFWQLARFGSIGATVVLHPPIDPAAAPSRKALAMATWATVAAGAARLRQNREWAIDAPDSLDSTRPSIGTVAAR